MFRHAVYVAPSAESPLARFAAAWLGRDAYSGAELPQPELPELAPGRLAEITASPRRYGFHATLKAPFELAPGLTERELHEAAERFAAGRRGFTVPLTLGSIGGFLALVPRAASAALDALAAEAVRDFDPFRAPLRPADLARRNPERLSPVEREHLMRWGYPYVFEAFRYHMTLTERLAEPEHGLVCQRLAELVAPYCEAPLEVDAICIFAQPEPGAPFHVTGRYGFGS